MEVDLLVDPGHARQVAAESEHGGVQDRVDPCCVATPRCVVWLVFLSDSNPFEQVSVDGSLATFTNDLGNTLTVDLEDPDFAS